MSKPAINEIYQKIKEKIVAGELSDRVVEQSLATEFGVSRTPVREVIRQLVQEGILVSIPNLGTFVKQYTLQEVKEIYEIRGALEGLSASLAASRISRDESHSLMNLAQQIEQERRNKNWQHAYELDKEFHKSIATYSRSKTLAETLDEYNFKVTCAYSNLFQPERFSNDNYQGVSHETIAAAITNNDSQEAEKQMKAHIAWAKQRILLA